jgi:drug/metabolite transporter (DMT)-like permease
MLKKINYGPLFIILAAVLWAFDGVVRRSLFSLPPLQIVFLEHLVGLVFLLPIILKLKLSDFKKVWKEVLVVVVFSGLLGTLLFTAALQKVFFISFSVVFLLQKLQPLFAIASAKIILKEKFSKKYWLWAVVALVAAYYVTFPTGAVSLSEQGDNVMAALYALGAAFFWGVSTTFSKKILKEVNPKKATSLRFLGTTILAGLVLLVLPLGSFVIPSPSQWLYLVFIALSTGMVALYLYYKGLRKTPVRVSTLLELVFPILAIVIDAVMYKTYLVPIQYISAGVLFFSLSKVVKLDKNSL